MWMQLCCLHVSSGNKDAAEEAALRCSEGLRYEEATETGAETLLSPGAWTQFGAICRRHGLALMSRTAFAHAYSGIDR